MLIFSVSFPILSDDPRRESGRQPDKEPGQPPPKHQRKVRPAKQDKHKPEGAAQETHDRNIFSVQRLHGFRQVVYRTVWTLHEQ